MFWGGILKNTGVSCDAHDRLVLNHLSHLSLNFVLVLIVGAAPNRMLEVRAPLRVSGVLRSQY